LKSFILFIPTRIDRYGIVSFALPNESKERVPTLRREFLVKIMNIMDFACASVSDNSTQEKYPITLLFSFDSNATF